MLDIAFAKPALPKSGALVLLIHEGEKPSGLWAQLDEVTGGAIARAFDVAEFKGAKGQQVAVHAAQGTTWHRRALGNEPADDAWRHRRENRSRHLCWLIAMLRRETEGVDQRPVVNLAGCAGK